MTERQYSTDSRCRRLRPKDALTVDGEIVVAADVGDDDAAVDGSDAAADDVHVAVNDDGGRVVVANQNSRN